MKSTLIFSLLLLAVLASAQNEKDYSLSKVKSYSGKYVFYNLEPFDAHTKAFFFENKVDANATLEQIMVQSVNNAMKESGFQGGEPFDAIIIKEGETRSKAIKFTTVSEKNANAKIGSVQLGVYVFVDCVPSNEYDYIATINCKWHTNPNERDKAFLELIERGKKKYSNFDGIIFKDDHHQTADLIKFRGLELTGGGFRIGDKVLFGSSSDPLHGEITQLDNAKQSANVRFLDEYGDETIKKVGYQKLTPLSNEQYEKSLKNQQAAIALHTFTLGEKVSWIEGKTTSYGEVVNLNPRNHDATLKYLDIYGDEKTRSRDYLKIDKLAPEQFESLRKADLENIAKHKFKLGEKVSFINDKSLKLGEIVKLNGENHKASVKYLGVFAEEQIKDIPYLELEKASEEKFKQETDKDIIAAQKYKFKTGEKVNWAKSGFLNTKQEIIVSEIVAIDDVNHKATIKFNTKEGVEKQETVSYLNLAKLP